MWCEYPVLTELNRTDLGIRIYKGYKSETNRKRIDREREGEKEKRERGIEIEMFT